MGLSQSAGKYHCALEWFSGVLSRRVHLRPVQKVCFDLTHDGITKTEGLHFRQKKSVIGGVKGFVKINCVAFVHRTRHRFLEDQQIGETGPTGQETMLMM